MQKFAMFSADVRNVFTDEATLLNFSELLTDTGRDCVKGISKEEANDKIREKFHAILGTDEHSTRKELHKAIRRHRVDLYEVIEETVENLLVSGWGTNPFFEQFVEMKNMSVGDENLFYVPDESVLTVSELSGNHHSLIRQRLGAGSSYQVKTSWYGIKIYNEFELYMNQKGMDWSTFVQKIYTAFDKKMNSMIYSSLMSAGSKLPSNAQFNKTSALTADTKATFIQLVEDVQAATGHEVVIMGTRTALSKLTALTDANWISDGMKDQRNSTGLLGIWEGIKLVVIPQVFADNDVTTKLVDNTKLLIMPLADNKFIKVVNEGDAQIKEVTDGTTNVDKSIEYEYQQKMGVSVIINMYFGIWTIV